MLSFFRKKKKSVINPKLTAHEKREKKWERMKKKTLKWGVLRHYSLIYKLQNAFSLYDVKNVLREWQNVNKIVAEVKDFSLSENDFSTLQRFVRIKQHQDHCDHTQCPIISQEEYSKITRINLESILLKTNINFESYYDNILLNYKNKNYKNKRLKYLIDLLDKEGKDELTDFSKVREKILYLKNKYEIMLTPRK